MWAVVPFLIQLYHTLFRNSRKNSVTKKPQEAAESLYTANADEIIRQQCIAREDAERREQTLERNYKLAQETIAEMSSTLAEKDSALAEKDSALAEKDSAMNKMKLEIEQLKALLENSSK